jgi:hypothetical protein
MFYTLLKNRGVPMEYEIIHNPETGKDEVGFIMFYTLL